MPFAIALLLWLALFSAAGSLLVQDEPAVRYVEQFGPFWASVFEAIGLTRFYLSPFFMAVVFLLGISTACCTVKRVSGFSRYFGNIRRQKRKVAYHIVIRQTGFFLVHLSFLFIMIGAIMDGNLLFLLKQQLGENKAIRAENISFRGTLIIGQDEKPVNQIVLHQKINGEQMLALPFAVSLDSLNITYNNRYQPKQYISHLSFHDLAGQLLFKKKLEVNRPVSYQGITLYQSGVSHEGTEVVLRKHIIDRADSAQPLRLVLNGASSGRERFGLENYFPVNPILSESMRQRQTESAHLAYLKQESVRDLGPSILVKEQIDAQQSRQWLLFLQPVTIDRQPFWVIGMISDQNQPMKRWAIPVLPNFSVDDFFAFYQALKEVPQRETLIESLVLTLAKEKKLDVVTKNRLKQDINQIVDIFIAEGMEGVFKELPYEMDLQKRQQTKETLLTLFRGIFNAWHGGEKKLTGDQVDRVLWAASSLRSYPSSIFLEPVFWQERHVTFIEASQQEGRNWIYAGFLLFVLGFTLNLIAKKESTS